MADGGLIMKRSLNRIIVTCLSVISLTLAAGCSGTNTEEWAYIHDAQTTILSLSDNGKAVFNDIKYTDQYLLYEKAVYQYQGEGEPDGLIGYWQEVDGYLSFEFTENGTFREDYYSPGYYFVDEEKGIVKLVYNDMYPDTYIYYSIDGDILTVDYPWPVVRTEK